MNSRRAEPQYVLCLSNEGYRASLVVRRVYRRLPDAGAARRGLFRVIDESGEDYLFPQNLFAPIALPRAVGRKLAVATQIG